MHVYDFKNSGLFFLTLSSPHVQLGLALQLSRGLRTGGVVAGALMLSIGLAMAIVQWKNLLDDERDFEENAKPSEQSPLLQAGDGNKYFA